MKNDEIEAPKTLSAAIKLALTDLGAVEKLKDVEVDMGNWHVASFKIISDGYENPCSVCFAGAVMHQTHQIPTYEGRLPLDFSPEWASVFMALDCARMHNIIAALSYYAESRYSDWRFTQAIVLAGIVHCSYLKNETKFKRNMRTIANRLAKLGC